MSRIGKQPIEIPSGVTITIAGDLITVKGAKGELTQTIVGNIKIKQEENELILERNDDTKEQKSLHGLFRSLLQNMIIGVSKGFQKRLDIIGVGYRANVQGKKVVLSLGYSHPIEYMVPEGVEVTQDPEKKSVLIVSGIDKQKVGQAAAEIRSYRKPEPYKGKGVRYEDEYVRRKAGKAATSG